MALRLGIVSCQNSGWETSFLVDGIDNNSSNHNVYVSVDVETSGTVQTLSLLNSGQIRNGHYEYIYQTGYVNGHLFSGIAGGVGMNTTMTIYIMPQPVISTPSPSTPTSFPTPYFDTGYCSSIAPTISEFGFELFKPDGVENCNMGWDEWTVGGYTMPAVQICFQPSDFGVIRMFGREFEVGTMALVAAAAFIWRFLRTV